MTIEDKNWGEFGYDRFLTRSLQSPDPNFQTPEDFNASTSSGAIRSATVGGNLYIKTMIVKDQATNIDRVLVGYQQNGF